MSNEITPEELERMEAGVSRLCWNCDHKMHSDNEPPCVRCTCNETGTEDCFENDTTRLIAAYRDALGRIEELEKPDQDKQAIANLLKCAPEIVTEPGKDKRATADVIENYYSPLGMSRALIARLRGEGHE